MNVHKEIQSEILKGVSNIDYGFLGVGEEPACPTFYVHQIHSHKVFHLTNAQIKSRSIQADAIVTNLSGIALGIVTADCVPMLLVDPDAQIIGALHAGWKGALYGVVEETVFAMQNLGATPLNIRAVIGPAIAQESYEVGPEFMEEFLGYDPKCIAFFKEGAKKNHPLFDLKGYVGQRLHNSGVHDFEALPIDTYTAEGRYESYRRATHQGTSTTSRNISYIIKQS